MFLFIIGVEFLEPSTDNGFPELLCEWTHLRSQRSTLGSLEYSASRVLSCSPTHPILSSICRQCSLFHKFLITFILFFLFRRYHDNTFYHCPTVCGQLKGESLTVHVWTIALAQTRRSTQVGIYWSYLLREWMPGSQFRNIWVSWRGLRKT